MRYKLLQRSTVHTLRGGIRRCIGSASAVGSLLPVQWSLRNVFWLLLQNLLLQKQLSLSLLAQPPQQIHTTLRSEHIIELHALLSHSPSELRPRRRLELLQLAAPCRKGTGFLRFVLYAWQLQHTSAEPELQQSFGSENPQQPLALSHPQLPRLHGNPLLLPQPAPDSASRQHSPQEAQLRLPLQPQLLANEVPLQPPSPVSGDDRSICANFAAGPFQTAVSACSATAEPPPLACGSNSCGEKPAKDAPAAPQPLEAAESGEEGCSGSRRTVEQLRVSGGAENSLAASGKTVAESDVPDVAVSALVSALPAGEDSGAAANSDAAAAPAILSSSTAAETVTLADEATAVAQAANAAANAAEEGRNTSRRIHRVRRRKGISNKGGTKGAANAAAAARRKHICSSTVLLPPFLPPPASLLYGEQALLEPQVSPSNVRLAHIAVRKLARHAEKIAQHAS
ncbi:hypothetical protein cyc_08946 [Cyclospora cayetanensis]|uniref:Uncharacterized protein n=1 Tax=Cyclospora cayetanensis TaxID=88456 RepID=A0A1D3D3H7_9EIME|nr:hypothetical protein cyc_08946 [Cyclospora cayetanensis]